MTRSLNHITPNERDALRLADTLGTALALATIFSPETCRLAADHIEGPDFTENEPELRPTIEAFVKLLREKEKS